MFGKVFIVAYCRCLYTEILSTEILFVLTYLFIIFNMYLTFVCLKNFLIILLKIGVFIITALLSIHLKPKLHFEMISVHNL